MKSLACAFFSGYGFEAGWQAFSEGHQAAAFAYAVGCSAFLVAAWIFKEIEE